MAQVVTSFERDLAHVESLARPMEEWGDGVRAVGEYAAGMVAALDHTLPPECLEEP